MLRNLATLISLGLLLEPAKSFAQDSQSAWYRADDLSKWDFAISIAAVNSAVDIVDSEIKLAAELDTGGFEASLDENLSISTTVVSGSLGYRVLPFLELSARAGLASTESETGVIITGTPSGAFADLFNGPITVDRDADLDVDGYSLGLGVTGYVPLANIGRDKLAAYAGFQYAWNRFDDDTIVSEASKTSLGLVFPVDPDRRDQIIYRLAGSYNWLTRDVERNQLIAGQEVDVKITQEYENPWAVELGAGIPLSRQLALGFAASHQLSGETSAFATVLYRFE